MIGRRRDRVEPHLFEPGDYGYWDGKLFASTPTGLLANLTAHEAVEHGDGTISVHPSILVTQGDRSWHGYLALGVWSTVS